MTVVHHPQDEVPSFVHSPSAHRSRATILLPDAIFLAVCAVQLAAIHRLNDGHVGYTLDDPYIHLALAENLLSGSYGINPGQESAPSSSILWPFLLVPLLALSLGALAPLLVNVVASIGTLRVWQRIVEAALPHRDRSPDTFIVPVVVTALVFATNLVGLVFTGMEHSLHVLLASLTVLGLIRERNEADVPWWLISVLIAGPLVRYEHLALTVPALLYLAIRGHWRAASIGALGVGLAVAAFSLFLHSRGLGILPTSVLVKSAPAASGGTLASLLDDFRDNLTSRQGLIVALWVVVLSLPVLQPRRWEREDRLLSSWAIAALSLHLLLGRVGWYHRYEIYAWTALLLTMLYVFRHDLARLHWRHPTVAGASLLAAVGLASWPYVQALPSIPIAANNIYEQHYQMHRFATEFLRAPVAVNDLGWVAFRNEHHVVDLWGLGSIEAYEARVSSTDTEWMAHLTRRYDVQVAMLYDSWFPAVPSGWQRVAELHLGKQRVTPAASAVVFFALEHKAVGDIVRHLREFRPTLPPGVELVIYDAPGVAPAPADGTAPLNPHD